MADDPETIESQMIGQLADIEGLVAGTAGTRIATDVLGVQTEATTAAKEG